MENLFASSERQHILDRLDKLQAGAARQWGKMDAAQMCAHCVAALEVGAGDVAKEHSFIGKVLGRFVKGSVLGEKPFSKNSPTDPSFVVTDARDFAKEKARLVAIVKRFGEAGPSAADGRMHSFFGRLTGDEWGVLMHKHLDHHLRQFGA
ncbi:MAG TPA: DUF1569 domain-containing protein [Thermoanaerobaculia bacterium]|nr:DUF1569 domain-containing protein [Thermoanaerobaculia bacterium]